MIDYGTLHVNMIESLIDMFDWSVVKNGRVPNDINNLKNGFYTLEYQMRCISLNLKTYRKWEWDGYRVHFILEKGMKFSFYGVICFQSQSMQDEIENSMTRVYSKWLQDYLDPLLKAIIKAKTEIEVLKIPIIEVQVPKYIVKLFGGVINGLVLTEGDFKVLSSREHGRYAVIDVPTMFLPLPLKH